jgi:biopolymer transport protein ExbD
VHGHRLAVAAFVFVAYGCQSDRAAPDAPDEHASPNIIMPREASFSVSVMADGAVLFNGQHVEVTELAAQLREAGADTDDAIVLSTLEEVPLAAVRVTLQELRAAHYENIIITSTP